MPTKEVSSTEDGIRGRDLWRRVPSRVKLRDVTLRDGLQSEDIVMPLEDKVALAKVITAAGIRELEVTAFVHPGKVPAMADAERLWQALPKRPDLVYSAILFNQRGLDRALEAGVDRVAVLVSASDEQSKRNTGMGIAEALNEAREVLTRAAKEGVETRSGVICAFGCRLEGSIPAERVADLARALYETGPREMTLADTSGTGDPRQVFERVTACRSIADQARLSLHLHDATGWALANLTTAMQLGVDAFDVTLGGLGGCPFLPGAPGNLAVHRVVRFLDAMGISTGVDLDRLDDGVHRLDRLISGGGKE